MTFRKAKDFFALQGQISLPETFDPTTSGFTVVLSNATGIIYEGTLFPADLERRGRRFTFKDKTAKKSGTGLRDGLFKVQFHWSRDNLWRIKLNAYSDLSAADVPEMTMSILMDGEYFETTATFDSIKKGFLLRRLTLP